MKSVSSAAWRLCSAPATVRRDSPVIPYRWATRGCALRGALWEELVASEQRSVYREICNLPNRHDFALTFIDGYC
jgi:hypothetical protein